MDILDHIADYIRAELGDDIFTEGRREAFMMQFRLEYGKDRHYVYSLAAKAETDRMRAIFAGLRAGLTTREIADRVGVTQRRVQQVIARTPMP